MEWLADNWAYLVVVFWVLEKLVKLTPWPYDDILVDVIWGAIKKLLNKDSK